ncbi:hypothetical protein DL93DRAFT_2068990, partial [Clavulina sp. PMI_390]
VCQFDGCNRKFAIRWALDRHVDDHNGIRPYQCTQPDCELRFTDAPSLATHLRTWHGIELPYPCPQCEKSYGSRRALTRHLKTHNSQD